MAKATKDESSSPQRAKPKSAGEARPKSKPASKTKAPDSDSGHEATKPKPKGRRSKKAVEGNNDEVPVRKTKSKKPEADNKGEEKEPSPPPATKPSRKRKPEAGAEKAKSIKKPRASAKFKPTIESESEAEQLKPDPKPASKSSSKPKKEATPPPPPPPAANAMDTDDSELSDEDQGANSDVPAKPAKKATTLHPEGPGRLNILKPFVQERKRKQSVQIKSREFIEDSDDENEGLRVPSASVPPVTTSKPKSTPKAPRTSGAKSSKSKGTEQKKDIDEGDKNDDLRSESEISVLLDHSSSPVKEKEKGSSGRGKGESESKESKPKKSRGKELSKDEEAIKRLKSFVVACGVRKMWSKEFKDMPNPSQQITHLRKILTDLGMGSRPSMEQARAIKVRRELAQELEDVKEFDAVVNAPRKGRAAAPRHSLAEPGEAADTRSEDEDKEEAVPRRKSAFGFLAGQSSDDE